MNAAPINIKISGVTGVTIYDGKVIPQISEKMISSE